MTSKQSYKWDPWPPKPIKSAWDSPGVYALVATKKGYSTLLGKKSRILYIGEAGNLYTRLRSRKEDDRPNHHFLGYWTAAKGNHHLPRELKKVLSKLNKIFDADTYGWKLDKTTEKENPWNNGKHMAPRKLLEEWLLIKHLFEFGQFPPLNAKVTSIKAIATYWNSWWGKCEKEPSKWRLPDVKECWKQMMDL